MTAAVQSIRARYQALIAEGTLKPDGVQDRIVARLEHLADEIATYRRPTERGFLSRIFSLNGAQAAPKSLYIWGDVGRGKTMLMDIFAETMSIEAKRRIHFHAFMQDVHARIFAVRKTIPNGDAVAQVAAAIGSEILLLCLDEMQVTDIADAMILGRLFEGLLAAGTVIVTTSNVPPDGLYRDGLNRQLFLPFVRLIGEKFDVVAADGSRDFRLGRIKGHRTFISPLGPEADAELQGIWEQLTDTERGRPAQIPVNGRALDVPQAARDCARFSFHEMCQLPLGPADFLALTAAYRTIFLEHIPQLTRNRRNETRRLVILVDTLYDARGRLVATCEVELRDLFLGPGHMPETARTVSRLEEMQSSAWWYDIQPASSKE